MKDRGRPLREACELLRLQLHPDWLDHQTTDRLLPPAEWEAIGRRVLPGSSFTPLHRALALHWVNDS